VTIDNGSKLSMYQERRRRGEGKKKTKERKKEKNVWYPWLMNAPNAPRKCTFQYKIFLGFLVFIEKEKRKKGMYIRTHTFSNVHSSLFWDVIPCSLVDHHKHLRRT
jgi:hypothetical protein